MDMLAHGLWTGIGVAVARRHWCVTRRQAGAAIALSVLPDFLQSIPLLYWIAAGDGTVALLVVYAFASPGTEPPMPETVGLLAHHLHCVTHSAVVALPVSLAAMMLARGSWFPLLGWWSHILIDVFTHSATFYPSPVFYPITYAGFDGIGWNEPWFLVLNYAALAATGARLYSRRRRADRIANLSGSASNE